MSQTQLVLFIIGMLAQYGLPALDKIVELVKKYNGATSIPEEDWKALFARIKAMDYRDYVPQTDK